MPGLHSILHVDDDDDIRAVTEMALTLRPDLDLRQCDSGFEAVEICKNFDPDLLLLDIMMPGMTGEEAWEEIRKLPGKADIAAIFLTAKAETATARRLMEKGALGVIPKPFDPIQLADQIESLWSASGLR